MKLLAPLTTEQEKQLKALKKKLSGAVAAFEATQAKSAELESKIETVEGEVAALEDSVDGTDEAEVAKLTHKREQLSALRRSLAKIEAGTAPRASRVSFGQSMPPVGVVQLKGLLNSAEEVLSPLFQQIHQQHVTEVTKVLAPYFESEEQARRDGSYIVPSVSYSLSFARPAVFMADSEEILIGEARERLNRTEQFLAGKEVFPSYKDYIAARKKLLRARETEANAD